MARLQLHDCQIVFECVSKDFIQREFPCLLGPLAVRSSEGLSCPAVKTLDYVR